FLPEGFEPFKPGEEPPSTGTTRAPTGPEQGPTSPGGNAAQPPSGDVWEQLTQNRAKANAHTAEGILPPNVKGLLGPGRTEAPMGMETMGGRTGFSVQGEAPPLDAPTPAMDALSRMTGADQMPKFDTGTLSNDMGRVSGQKGVTFGPESTFGPEQQALAKTLLGQKSNESG